MANPVPKMDNRLTNINPVTLLSLKLNVEKNPVKVKAIMEGKNNTKENTKADKTVEETSMSLDFTVVVLIA